MKRPKLGSRKEGGDITKTLQGTKEWNPGKGEADVPTPPAAKLLKTGGAHKGNPWPKSKAYDTGQDQRGNQWPYFSRGQNGQHSLATPPPPPPEEAKEPRDNWDTKEDTLKSGASGSEGAAPNPLIRKDERKPGTGEADV